MTFPDRVTVYHKLASSPEAATDSFTLDVLILSEKHRRAAARCVEDVVLYDYRHSKKLALASMPFMLNALRETYELQEREREKTLLRREKLERRVRSLEKASWDRADATEDVGSAGPQR